MPASYTPPAHNYGIVRCAIARALIYVLSSLLLLALRIVPSGHPFRIFLTERVRGTKRNLSKTLVPCAACREKRPTWTFPMAALATGASATAADALGLFGLF